MQEDVGMKPTTKTSEEILIEKLEWLIESLRKRESEYREKSDDTNRAGFYYWTGIAAAYGGFADELVEIMES